jgi:hypothetical protein
LVSFLEDYMKVALIALLLAITLVTVEAKAEWTLAADDSMVYSGQTATVPLPLTTQFDPLRGYVITPAFVTHFIVRVGPASVRRGCDPTGQRPYTGVHSSLPRIRPTAHVNTYPSTAKRGWTNYEFEVNGGHGAPVQAIKPAFVETGYTDQCYFDVLWTAQSAAALRAGDDTRPNRAAAPGKEMEKVDRGIIELKGEHK